MRLNFSDVAETYLEERQGATTLWLRKEALEALNVLDLAHPETLEARSGPDCRRLEGRGRLLSVPLGADAETRAVVRTYLHGGLSALFFGGLFMGRSRAEMEMLVAEYAQRCEVPTFQPLGSITRRVLGLWYRAWLVSVEIPDSLDLINYLRSGPALEERRSVFEKAGRAVRVMHDAGIYHADLHLKNLLVQRPGDPDSRVFILDWDKSRIFTPLPDRARFQNLARLDRSGAKLARKGVPVTPLDRMRFLRGYQDGDRSLLSARDFQRQEIYWKIHALGWRLGEIFS